MTRLSEQSVLIVDDDEQFRLSLSKIFAKVGYKVSTAADALEAMDILNRSFQHLVIADQRLPNMSGLQLLKQIKSKSPKSKVLIVTAYGDLTMRNEALHVGAFAFLDKPVKRQQILKLAAEALQDRQIDRI